MRWRRTLGFLAAITLSEAVGVRSFDGHLLTGLFAVGIPAVLVGVWLVLAAHGPGAAPATPPGDRSAG